ncbi:DUF7742 family protein [Inquilinus sp. OTU3971]|uniref:DUF7742 family protein n=1 Tax=Inquilinus sp. OTU3971 TaxID=3043855 RepID=UPI00313DDFF2
MTDRTFPRYGSEYDLDIATRTLYGEARSKPVDDDAGVVWVLVNRAREAQAYINRTGKCRHPLFGDGTVASAALMPWQFSCWNSNDPNLPKMKALSPADAGYQACRQVVEAVVAGRVRDPTRGSKHYLTTALLRQINASSKPHWAKGQGPAVVLGPHAFFNNIA